MGLRTSGGRQPRLGEGVYIDPAAQVIGEVELGDHVSVWPQAVIRGDIHRIHIGARTNIQDGSVLHVTHDSSYAPGGHPLVVGERVTVGHRAILHGCEVGDECLIGMGAIVMDGAVLAPRVLLGAGSVVTPGQHLEGGYVWVGSPAVRMRPLRESELSYLGYAADHYVRLKDRYLAEADG